MSKKSPYIEHLIHRAVFELLRCLDVELSMHKDCLFQLHYIVFFDGKIFVLHEEQLDETDGNILMQKGNSDNCFLTDSQRATLIERLTVILRSAL